MHTPTVLMCGYGKIGHIKSSIWQKLGAKVYVREKDVERVEKAREDGYIAALDLESLKKQGLADKCIIDLSVPAGWHVAALREVLDAFPACRTVLIEKPVVSSREELAELRALLRVATGQAKIFLDESYYASIGLERLKVAVRKQQKDSPITSVVVDFFKNRMPDVLAGRFVDEVLGAYGVEVPPYVCVSEVSWHGRWQAYQERLLL